MGLAQRLELQAELEAILGGVSPEERVSFQPDEESTLKYPHIVYARDPAYTVKADNTLYRSMDHYKVTHIDRKPDNPVLDILIKLPYCSPTTSFIADGLHHDVFDLYH